MRLAQEQVLGMEREQAWVQVLEQGKVLERGQVLVTAPLEERPCRGGAGGLDANCFASGDPLIANSISARFDLFLSQ